MRTPLSLAFVCLVHLVEGNRHENTRSSYFNMIPQHRLTGHLITTTTADTELACAHKCLRNEQCKSCNFKEIPQKLSFCELNSKPLLSQTHNPALIHDESFLFISLKHVSFTQTITVKRYFCSITESFSDTNIGIVLIFLSIMYMSL